MIKQLKALTIISAMTLASLASAPAAADNFVASVQSAATTTAIGRNTDGAASQADFLQRIGRLFDATDARNTGTPARLQLTDREIMERTFRIDAGG